MANRIEVAFREGFTDAAGQSIAKRIAQDLGIAGISSVRTIDVYTLDSLAAPLTYDQLLKVANEVFCDAVTQQTSIDSPLAKKAGFDFLVEVGYLPGVKDNVGDTATEAVTDALFGWEGGRVYSSRQYLLKFAEGVKPEEKQVQAISKGLLANTVIERFTVHPSSGWDDSKGAPATVPSVKLDADTTVREVVLDVSDDELKKISKERLLSLSVEELRAVTAHLSDARVMQERRWVGCPTSPTDVELEAIAQTWSEHCKHKIFSAKIEYADHINHVLINSLYKSYIQRATNELAAKKPWLVSVFTDNAGIIRFNDEWLLAMKVETHNSPSALDPYGGAVTGIVGVNRDIMGAGLGGSLLFNTDVFCFAPPDYDKPLPPGVLSPKRIFEGVRRGVEHGGNKSGVPTVNGSLVFDNRFLGRPLVYCGTGGLIPSKILGKPGHQKTVSAGDVIVMAGGRIGRDGVHGATFSSQALSEHSPATAVQIGDPITQKKLADFILEARDRGLYSSLTDNGAGGLSSSVGEMARLCGGCELHLEKCPLKYSGLAPWEILVSESQERMTLSVPPQHLEEFLSLASLHGVEATPIGVFTDTGKFHVRFREQTVAYLDLFFLHEGVPQLKLKAYWSPPEHDEPAFDVPTDLTLELHRMLARFNVCSKEYVVRQYDHEVQAHTVVKPLSGVEFDGPSDAGVLKPRPGSWEGIVISHGICPRYSDLDAYYMAGCAFDEALRNYVATGGDPDSAAALDNFCWPDPVGSTETPDGEYKLAQLVRANQALYDAAIGFGVPLISGKDSMKNDFKSGSTKISVPPTLLITMVGKVPDVRKAVTMDVKAPGDKIFVIGFTKNELGGSEYFSANGFKGNHVPKVNIGAAADSYRALYRAVQAGLVESCHDCSDGGLAVALAESAFAGGLGIKAALETVPRSQDVAREDYLMFSETPSRLVVTVAPENASAFEKLMKEANVLGVACIGEVLSTPDVIFAGLTGGEIVVKTTIQSLKESWQKTLRW